MWQLQFGDQLAFCDQAKILWAGIEARVVQQRVGLLPTRCMPKCSTGKQDAWLNKEASRALLVNTSREGRAYAAD